jgi:hypothetical protein
MLSTNKTMSTVNKKIEGKTMKELEFAPVRHE